jgi:hypothetical protein
VLLAIYLRSYCVLLVVSLGRCVMPIRKRPSGGKISDQVKIALITVAGVLISAISASPVLIAIIQRTPTPTPAATSTVVVSDPVADQIQTASPAPPTEADVSPPSDPASVQASVEITFPQILIGSSSGSHILEVTVLNPSDSDALVTNINVFAQQGPPPPPDAIISVKQRYVISDTLTLTND